MTGLTGVVQVKDHNRLEATLNKLITIFHDRVEQPATDQDTAQGTYHRSRIPRIVKTAFAGQAIYHLVVPTDFPMAPAWCLTEKELIIATFPQNIKAYLSRGKDFQSLAAVPDVAAAIGEEGAVALSYCDTRKMAEYAYPLLCFGAKAITSELNREGIPLDCSLLPSAAAIYPHLHPSIGVVRRTAAGIEVASRGPLAGIGAGPISPASFLFLGIARVEPRQTPMAMASDTAATFPATRVEARQTPMAMAQAQAVPMPTNNLKQIALAALNYESATRTLPPSYISAKETGKPLLSWRVAILPYLDQQQLYQQFHLDEPWDSPHNKSLIPLMPQVYRSTGPAAAMGKTRYLTLRSKESAFPGKEGVRLADITHGTSNTILAVEADQAHAVVWTKPDDLDLDPQKPAAGLAGQPRRGFWVALCDGSVRFIQDSIDTEFLQDMVNRHGERPAKTR